LTPEQLDTLTVGIEYYSRYGELLSPEGAETVYVDSIYNELVVSMEQAK
jgi:hypothetical protein